MSFSRFAAHDSDVYTFPCVTGHYECCGCILDPAGQFRTTDVDAFIAHLDDHTAAGHTVPDYTRGAVRAWAEDYPDGWAGPRASFRFVGSGLFAGTVREAGFTTWTCPHAHRTTTLARACAEAHLKETPR